MTGVEKVEVIKTLERMLKSRSLSEEDKKIIKEKLLEIIKKL